MGSIIRADIMVSVSIMWSVSIMVSVSVMEVMGSMLVMVWLDRILMVFVRVTSVWIRMSIVVRLVMRLVMAVMRLMMAVMRLMMAMMSRVLFPLHLALEQLVYHLLRDATAKLSRVKHEAIPAVLLALQKREAHAGILVPELTLRTLRILVQALLLAIAIALELTCGLFVLLLFFLLFLFLLFFLLLFLFLFLFLDGNAGTVLLIDLHRGDADNLADALTLLKVRHDKLIVLGALDAALRLGRGERTLLFPIYSGANLLFLFLLFFFLFVAELTLFGVFGFGLWQLANVQ